MHGFAALLDVMNLVKSLSVVWVVVGKPRGNEWAFQGLLAPSGSSRGAFLVFVVIRRHDWVLMWQSKAGGCVKIDLAFIRIYI